MYVHDPAALHARHAAAPRSQLHESSVGVSRPLSGVAHLLDHPVAHRIAALSVEKWGLARQAAVIGQDRSLCELLDRTVRFAAAGGPVLITGETGTGKELVARAVYLLSARVRKPFVAVNCAQYHEGQLLASELFGHRRGAFTGATQDHKGVFQEAEGGVVFLDEIGELSVPAQAMLLRALGEHEIVPVGSTRPIPVNVRVIAATSRDLRPMMAAGTFREDLYFRLRNLHLKVPPLRERGDDWRLILEHYLTTVNDREGVRKRFSAAALRRLASHTWPGNVRELRSLVDTGFYVCDGVTIESEHFAESLEELSREAVLRTIPLTRAADRDRYARLLDGDGTFWELVHGPYLNRELSRVEVRAMIARGLAMTQGSYKKLLPLFGLREAEYLKFMDFLRHHELKPEE